MNEKILSLIGKIIGKKLDFSADSSADPPVDTSVDGSDFEVDSSLEGLISKMVGEEIARRERQKLEEETRKAEEAERIARQAHRQEICSHPEWTIKETSEGCIKKCILCGKEEVVAKTLEEYQEEICTHPEMETIYHDYQDDIFCCVMSEHKTHCVLCGKMID